MALLLRFPLGRSQSKYHDETPLFHDMKGSLKESQVAKPQVELLQHSEYCSEMNSTHILLRLTRRAIEDDIPKAIDSARRAFGEGSMTKYFSVGRRFSIRRRAYRAALTVDPQSADTTPFRGARSTARYYLLFDDGVHKGRMLTVDKGAALMR